MDEIKKYFDQYSLLTISTWQKLKEILISRNLNRGEIFCKEGSKYSNEFFVLEGTIRGYYISYKKDEVNVSFYPEKYFATPYFYRNLKGNSTINLQSIEKSVIIEFNAEKFADLMRQHNDLENFGRIIIEKELKERIEKEIYLLSRSAEDRYEYFQQQFPGLENKIPHYHIASYLGITPISLSRLRRKILKKT